MDCFMGILSRLLKSLKFSSSTSSIALKITIVQKDQGKKEGWVIELIKNEIYSGIR